MKMNKYGVFLCLIVFVGSYFVLVYHTLLVSKLKKSGHQENLRSSTIQTYKQDTTKEEMATPMPMVILYWSTYFEKKPPHFVPGFRNRLFTPSEKSDCPVPCEMLTDRSRANESSAFIVHARDAHMTPPSKAVPWILHTNENPVHTPALKNPRFLSQFQLLISYRLDSDFPSPIFPRPELTPPIPFKKRYGNIMATFSNCERVRTAYMKQLMKYVQVDSYGSCLRNKNGLIPIYGTAFKEQKMNLTRHYKFSLVFMNQDCDYFIDDRLYHALSSGSVPVYMGTEKVDEFLPGNLNKSIIKVRDFKSPKDLADYLTYLSNNETAYNQYLEWKWKGLGDIKNTVMDHFWNPKYHLHCQICLEVLSKGKTRHKDGLKPDYCKARRAKDWGI